MAVLGALFELASSLYDVVYSLSVETDSNSTDALRAETAARTGLGFVAIGSGNFGVYDDFVDGIGKNAVKKSDVLHRYVTRESDRVLNGTATGVNLSEERLRHIMSRHTVGGREVNKTSSIFDYGVDIRALTEGAQGMPIIRMNNQRYQITYNTGSRVGIDVATGQPTSLITVITEPDGYVYTAYPGLPKSK